MDISACDVDWIALSGHEMYAPFGAGALIGRSDWLATGEPFLAGGGAVRYVGVPTFDGKTNGRGPIHVVWADLPDRAEAGTPNLVGAVALGVACRTLTATDHVVQAAEETQLADRAEAALAAIPGVRCHRLWDATHPRIGVVWTYRTAADGADAWPDPDPRPRPDLPFDLA